MISVHTLPSGTRLLDYRITGVLGEGGFGIVYLAFDELLEREVALKEYLPSAIASRASGSMTVMVRSQGQHEAFTAGMKSFVNEAKLLAKFDHPALVKVYRFWEANQTAYMVMPRYEGPTLKRALAELGRPPSEAEIRAWLWPLLDALQVLHADQCFHRDIAPDNVVLTATGPVLLDFGAARRVVGEMTHDLTAILKPGFAPIEQYGDLPGMSQGPWTDIYALAGVIYTAIAGRRPVPSIERLLDDRMVPLRETAAGRRYSAAFLAAVDGALAVRIENRPQTIASFRAMLDGLIEPAAAAPQPTPMPAPRPMRTPTPTPTPAPKVPASAPAPARQAAAVQPAREFRAMPAVRPRPDRLGYQVAGGAAAAALVALGIWFYGAGRARPDPPPASTGAPGPAAPGAPGASGAPAAAEGRASAAPSPMPRSPSAGSAAATAAPETVGSAATASGIPPAVDQPAAAASRPSGGIRPSITAASSSARVQASAAAPPARAPERPVQPPASASRTAEPALARPAADPSLRAKCSDILQKGSLEPLTPGETAFLKRECQ